MGEALFELWIEATRAQGDPAKYSKTDLEMFVMRLFDRFPFKAGKSQREKRRSFEETWEVSQGNTEAVAYGFDSALKAGIYTMPYVKACIKNFALTGNYTKPKPVQPLEVKDVAKAKDFTFSMPKVKPTPKPAVKRSRKSKVALPTEKVEWH